MKLVIPGTIRIAGREEIDISRATNALADRFVDQKMTGTKLVNNRLSYSRGYNLLPYDPSPIGSFDPILVWLEKRDIDILLHYQVGVRPLYSSVLLAVFLGAILLLSGESVEVSVLLVFFTGLFLCVAMFNFFRFRKWLRRSAIAALSHSSF